MKATPSTLPQPKDHVFSPSSQIFGENMAENQTNSRTVLFWATIAGFLVFLLFAGISGFDAWQRYSHSKSWIAADAKVTETFSLCDLQSKSGKNWNTSKTIPCDEANQLVTQNSSLLSQWRAVEVPFYRLEYPGAASIHNTEVRAFRFGRGHQIGDTVAIYFDPAKPTSVDSPFSSSDLESFYTLSGIGLAIWLGAILLGLFVAKMNSRAAQNTASSAVAGVVQQGVDSAVANTAPPEMHETVVGRMVRYASVVVLAISLLLAAVILFGQTGGNGGQLSAAIACVGLGAFIWRMGKWFANATRKPIA
ncbi:MAG: hypothetical protein R3D34_06065 [Nitratireductor sp.]